MKKKELLKRISALEEAVVLNAIDILKITEKLIEIKEVDFSILNEDDVVYAEFTDGESAVLKGELLGDRISSTQCIYSHTGWDCGINEFTFDYVKSLRLATTDEKELLYRHFPKKHKV